MTVPTFPAPEVLAARQKIVLDHFHDEVSQDWETCWRRFRIRATS